MIAAVFAKSSSGVGEDGGDDLDGIPSEQSAEMIRSDHMTLYSRAFLTSSVKQKVDLARFRDGVRSWPALSRPFRLRR